MTTRRAHVVIAQELVAEIDRIVGKRQRSEFLAEAAERELLRQRQLEALRAAAGAWTTAGRRGSSALLVRRLRAENERRLKRLDRRA